MLGVIGSALLLMAAFILGLTIRKKDKDHLCLLREVISLIRHARRKISLFATPINELFGDFSEATLPILKNALKTANPKDAINNISSLLGGDGDILRKMYNEIATGYKEDAVRACDYATERMTDRATDFEKKYNARKNLYVSLPLLFAVSVIVLLL